MDNDITIREAQQLVDQWIKQYGVRYFSELTNMACLTEEVGELARIMARKYGDQSFKQGEEQDPADEMADVLWVLMCLANQTGVDLTEALRKNLEKKTSRDKTRHINNEKLKVKLKLYHYGNRKRQQEARMLTRAQARDRVSENEQIRRGSEQI